MRSAVGIDEKEDVPVREIRLYDPIWDCFVADFEDDCSDDTEFDYFLDTLDTDDGSYSYSWVAVEVDTETGAIYYPGDPKQIGTIVNHK